MATQVLDGLGAPLRYCQMALCQRDAQFKITIPGRHPEPITLYVCRGCLSAHPHRTTQEPIA